jgi:GR25 family glycosyltransferase involved in LPS biosynthesis
MVKIERSICLTVVSRRAEFAKIDSFHKEIGLPLVRFDGVLGSTLTRKSVVLLHSSSVHKSLVFTATKRARLAIALSHINIWKSLKSYGDSYSLILEDDVVLTKDSMESVNSALNSINFNWDILFLGHSGKLKGAKKESFVIAQGGHYPDTNHGMFAYVINPKSIDKVLNAIGKLQRTQHIDWLLREKYGRSIVAVYCNPSIISHNNKIQSIRKKLDRI